MKPSVPERGLVVAVERDMAKVMLVSGEACRGCNQARIGLCRAADLSIIVAVKNTLGARIGETVTIGIDEGIRIRGYLFAFIIPLLSLFLGTIIGVFYNNIFPIKSLDVISGFLGLFAGSLFSLRSLKRLDSKSYLVIRSILSAQDINLDSKGIH
ncbi:MAG: SoxR reducing system RseC family protein [Thermodesulfovibrionales bacterium]|nr:SoxR reducing system RseC family protein [Thermodesulfovibrionales bacterium]